MRKAELMDLFPELAQRISTCNMTARRAIVREVQGRRVAQEWTMEGINSAEFEQPWNDDPAFAADGHVGGVLRPNRPQSHACSDVRRAR